ncbi:MAG TPA: sigma-70 family RNA polymerase sigma factor [Dehalococcoidia bacterium]|jgi:RNA polymerase sigma-70 factor (ECF subfamily)|nr:sigma-70 family RNA polymerase sigma factor [Dehalococcoidia bacterium]
MNLFAGPSAQTADEPELLRRARGGDLDAFNALVDLHQRLVYNICRRMLGSTTAAEDATQDTFLSAYRHIGRCTGERFQPWLLRIAANACTDELRRRGRRPAVSLDAPRPVDDADAHERALDVPDTAAGPESEALRSEQRRAIAAALLRLPEDQRLAVILCDVQGFTYEEIADSTKASLGTVKSRIARGREKLRRELRAMGTIGEAGAS